MQVGSCRKYTILSKVANDCIWRIRLVYFDFAGIPKGCTSFD